MAEYTSNQAYLLEARQFISVIACSLSYHGGLHCSNKAVAGIVKKYGYIQMYTILFIPLDLEN